MQKDCNTCSLKIILVQGFVLVILKSLNFLSDFVFNVLIVDFEVYCKNASFL